jgi:hypothetical protein
MVGSRVAVGPVAEAAGGRHISVSAIVGSASAGAGVETSGLL